MTMPFSESPHVEITEVTLPCETVLIRLNLYEGPLHMESLAVLNQTLSAIPPRIPVLLQSFYSSLPMLQPSQEQEQEWILAAGAYRLTQERFKAAGGTLISLVTSCLVGGTYLIHGMSARHRFVYPEVTIYPSLPPERYESVFQKPYPHATTPKAALQAGIITEIITVDAFHHRLAEILTQA